MSGGGSGSAVTRSVRGKTGSSTGSGSAKGRATLGGSGFGVATGSGASGSCRSGSNGMSGMLPVGALGGATESIAFSVAGPGRSVFSTGTASAGPTPANVFFVGSSCSTGSCGAGAIACSDRRRTNMARSPRARLARAVKIGRNPSASASTDGKRAAGSGASARVMAACSRPSQAGGGGGPAACCCRSAAAVVPANGASPESS